MSIELHSCWFLNKSNSLSTFSLVPKKSRRTGGVTGGVTGGGNWWGNWCRTFSYNSNHYTTHCCFKFWSLQSFLRKSRYNFRHTSSPCFYKTSLEENVSYIFIVWFCEGCLPNRVSIVKSSGRRPSFHNINLSSYTLSWMGAPVKSL